MQAERLNELLAELSWSLPAGTEFTEGGEGIAIDYDGKHLHVTHKTDADLARSLVLLKQFGTDRPYTYAESSCFETLGVMIDCSRNAVLTPDSLRRVLRLLALMGYNMVQLYTEETYEVDGEPYFGYLRGRYSKEELRELDAYAASLGIEMIPCIQVLAHLGSLMNWKTYRNRRDCDDILLCGDERTYELIDRMLASLSESVRSRRIHIGMDEAHMVGLGAYLDKNGFKDRFDILVRHLDRVCALAKKYGYHPMMWSDMFFRLGNHGNYYLEGNKWERPDNLGEVLPQDIALVYWDYYTTNRRGYDEMMEAHNCFDREIWFAGGAWRWAGFAPFNEYAIGLTELAFGACRRKGIRHAFTTAWGDDGGECSIFAILPTLSVTADIAYGHTSKAYYKRFFRALTDIRFEDYMVIDSLNRLYPENPLGSDPAKHLLYNDPLLGQFDNYPGTDYELMRVKLDAAIRPLTRLSRNPRFGAIFRTQKELAEVLRLKCDFGVRARAAYRAGDRTACVALSEEAKRILGRIDRFYEAFRAQWMQENKPQGFDVQDLRLGGLMQRMRVTMRLLSDFGTGRIDRIAEFEEDILPYDGFSSNNWATNATPNKM